MPLLALDLFARIVAMRVDAGPPFSALFTLWLSIMAAVGLGFSLLLFTTLLIKSVVHAFQRAIVGPQIEVVMNRTFRRQVFRDRAPLASGGEHVHETVYHLAHNHSTLVAAAPYRVGSKVRLTATRCQSDRSDSATCCGRNGLGSCSSTSGDPFRITGHHPSITSEFI